MPPVPPIPFELWVQIPPAAQVAILAVIQQYEQRLQALRQQVAQLTERLNQNSTNSSLPSLQRSASRQTPPPNASNGPQARGDSPVTHASNALWCRPNKIKQDHPLDAPRPAASAGKPFTAKTRSPAGTKSPRYRPSKPR